MSHVSFPISTIPQPVSPQNSEVDALGFTRDQLERVAFMPPPSGQRWNFHEVCTFTLMAIRQFGNNPSQTITFNQRAGEHILDFVNLGLPEGKSNISSTDVERQQSWVHEILARLVNNGSIAEFEITLFEGRLEICITKIQMNGKQRKLHI
jgi:hypothetical protein